MTYTELSQRVAAANTEELSFILGVRGEGGKVAQQLIVEALKAAQARQ